MQTFVGRQKALQKLATLGAPVVTSIRFLIAGDGGLGKSALAAQITKQLESVFQGGILLAEIPTDDVFLKLGEWAELYEGDVSEIQDLNQRADRVRQIILQRVGNKRVLAALDGVVDENDNVKIAPLLRALRDCAVIVTSRVRQLSACPDAWLLDLPRLDEEETWELFQRVLLGNVLGAPELPRLNGKRAVIGEIGRLVDFMPLALDLAAAQLRDHETWQVEYLRDELRDEKRRLDLLQWGDGAERGIRATILLSYKRLTADERKFLDALGAFAGNDFDVSAAAAVCETDAETARKRLAKLRRVSILQDGTAPERYKLHALMRTFTREQCGKDLYDAELRMATHYCQLARENGGKLKGKEIDQALKILDIEKTNIFAGQKWARENETREARELTRDYIYGAMANYFLLRANWAEWIEWSEFGIAACQALEDERGEGAIAGNLGSVYYRKGEWDRAIAFYQQSLATKERLGDAHGMAQTYNNLGLVYADKGEWDQAIAFYQQSLATKERLGDAHGMAKTYNNLGLVYADKGEWDQAIAFYQNALRTMERLGDVHGMAQTYNNLGNVYANKGEWDQAIAFYQQSLNTTEKIGDVVTSANNYWGLGIVYENQSDFKRAVEFCNRAMNIWLKIQSPHAKTYQAHLEELKKRNAAGSK